MIIPPVHNLQSRRIGKYSLVAAATTLLLIATSAPKCFGQDVFADFYQSEIQSSNPVQVLLMKHYVRGAFDGIQIANAVLVSQKQTPLYCQPDNRALDTDRAIEMIDSIIEPMTMPDKKKVGILLILILALQRAFPCAK